MLKYRWASRWNGLDCGFCLRLVFLVLAMVVVLIVCLVFRWKVWFAALEAKYLAWVALGIWFFITASTKLYLTNFKYLSKKSVNCPKKWKLTSVTLGSFPSSTLFFFLFFVLLLSQRSLSLSLSFSFPRSIAMHTAIPWTRSDLSVLTMKNSLIYAHFPRINNNPNQPLPPLPPPRPRPKRIRERRTFRCWHSCCKGSSFPTQWSRLHYHTARGLKTSWNGRDDAREYSEGTVAIHNDPIGSDKWHMWMDVCRACHFWCIAIPTSRFQRYRPNPPR